MLNSIKSILFSTKLTAFLLVVFSFAIGYATFIENDYGTAASKALIFNTKWFELILLLLTINLIGNVFKYKLFRLEKTTTLMFHFAFIVIIIGAGITRYISFEGSMHIREGEMSNTIVSADTYLQFKVDDKVDQLTYDDVLYLNSKYNSKFNHSFNFKGNQIAIAYKGFIPNSIDTVVVSDKGKSIIEIVTVGQSGRVSRYIESGQTKFFGEFPVAFNDDSRSEAIKISETDSGLIILSPYDIKYLSMDDKSTAVLAKDTVHQFKNRRLYTVNDVQLVFKEVHKNVVIKQMSAPKENKNGEDALIVDVTCNDKVEEVILFGGKGYASNHTIFQLDNLNISLAYGSKRITTPFSIRLNKFILERYPGSMSPSSFESEVTLLDNRDGGVEIDHRIYMNNVLDYDGYRFFQSSYDQDGKGTVLSVNHDFWGTMVTYIGYFFLFLGMILTLMRKSSRFASLRKSIKKLRARREVIVGLFFLLSTFSVNNLSAQHEGHDHEKSIQTEELVIDEMHADKFAHLLVQDQGGRIKPIHTFASEVLRKLYGKEEFKGQSPAQVLLGMMHNPSQWQTVKMIKVRNPELEKQLGAEDHYVSFVDFFDEKFNYIITKDVEEAKRKKPSEQSKYDKELIKVDERVNICYMVFQGSLMKVFPKYKDANNTWFTSMDYKQFTTHDSIFVKAILPMYFGAISQSFKANDWSLADSTLKHIVDYQHKFGADVIPSQSKIDAEIKYNKINIFKKLFMYYGLIGLLMLFFLFADIFSPKKWKRIVINVLIAGLFILFLSQIAGLAARWYISGHAPWSNGYESMIYIAFVTMLAGFVFLKQSKMTVAATAFLASLILMVAHLNFMDPEITPLVPVLKSYWLMIHVAVITGSYGFLGLGALLGFINLLLMIFKTAKNKIRINDTLKELTLINEMTITVGLFMAAIGTFLGGIWANESWGRYWGWDPKETWALVIVLYYAMLLHLRFIPKANGKFLFNLLSVLGLGVVLMTYFGVNYYLSGLHSYAAGDPVPIPTFVPISAGVIIVIAVIAYFRNKKDKV
ncbi:MAG: cytochrome c biogenesis protein CcsA [Flavobacteriales bacterium]|nr:cytochrome c biogenesis protein CcsA [Flavobacteriales bacterium]